MSTAHPTVAKTDFWTADRVADALAPLSPVNLPRGAFLFGRVSTDTRTIEDGDLFVALVGEQFDAHDFLKDAVAKGAKGLVVSRHPERREGPLNAASRHPERSEGPLNAEEGLRLGVPVYEVRDTLVALGALGTYRRRALNKPVVAVVGSNGKTSAKELIKAALGSRLEVHATTGNLNNLIGVPLTLLAMPDSADVAVVEMGTNQPGEIPRLRAIVEPNITVVTSIAEEHLEGFGDLAGVLKEEMSATDGVAVAIVPASQPEVVAAAKARAKRVVSTGIDAGDVRPTRWSIETDGRGTLTLDGVDVHLPLRGLHNLRNAMLAFAVAREAGISVDDAGRGIAAMQMPPMRSNVEDHGQITLINDAYNSNPGSARAAIELLEHAGKGRQRVAVLGTMLELGAQGPRLHDDVARAALDAGIEIVAGVGEFADALGRVAAGDARVVAAADIDALWSTLSSRLAPNAVILLKGSRGMRLERLVTPIAEWSRSRAST